MQRLTLAGDTCGSKQYCQDRGTHCMLFNGACVALCMLMTSNMMRMLRCLAAVQP